MVRTRYFRKYEGPRGFRYRPPSRATQVSAPVRFLTRDRGVIAEWFYRQMPLGATGKYADANQPYRRFLTDHAAELPGSWLAARFPLAQTLNEVLRGERAARDYVDLLPMAITLATLADDPTATFALYGVGRLTSAGFHDSRTPPFFAPPAERDITRPSWRYAILECETQRRTHEIPHPGTAAECDYTCDDASPMQSVWQSHHGGVGTWTMTNGARRMLRVPTLSAQTYLLHAPPLTLWPTVQLDERTYCAWRKIDRVPVSLLCSPALLGDAGEVVGPFTHLWHDGEYHALVAAMMESGARHYLAYLFESARESASLADLPTVAANLPRLLEYTIRFPDAMQRFSTEPHHLLVQLATHDVGSAIRAHGRDSFFTRHIAHAAHQFFADVATHTARHLPENLWTPHRRALHARFRAGTWGMLAFGS